MASNIEPKAALSEEAALDKLRALREVKDETQETQATETEVLEATEEPTNEHSKEEHTGEVPEVVAQAAEVSDATSSNQDDAEQIELDVEQLSSILGIEADFLDVDDSGKFHIKTNVDGQQGKTTLKDLVKSYQIDKHLTQKGQEIQKLEEQRKRELSEFVNKTQSFAQQASQVMEVLKETYLQPLSAQEMAELRVSDPAEWAAKMQEQKEREAKFSGVANRALQQIEEAQKVQGEEMQRQYQAYLHEQSQILEKNIPNVREKGKEIVSYAQTQGFSENEINQIADARVMTLIYKAMMFDKGSAGVKSKLSKPLPKVIKPSARVGKHQVALEELNTKRNALRKTGSDQDALALLKSMRK